MKSLFISTDKLRNAGDKINISVKRGHFVLNIQYIMVCHMPKDHVVLCSKKQVNGTVLQQP